MIRKFTANDKEKFLKFTRDFYASDAVDHDIPEYFHEDLWLELLRSEQYTMGYMIENEKEEAIGYALFAKTYSHEAGGMVWWLEELYIEPLYRGKGFGKEFFKYIESLKEENVTRIRLEVEEDNTKAIKLYRAMGYEVLPYGQMIKQYRV